MASKTLILQPLLFPISRNPNLHKALTLTCSQKSSTMDASLGGGGGRRNPKKKYGTSRRSKIKKSFSQEQIVFTTPIPSDPTVAVIGGGMSGLVCASTLEERGIRSTVFDTVGFDLFPFSLILSNRSSVGEKGMHGLGGRMGTRTVNDQSLVFDHAAQFFTVSDPRFQKFVDRWLEEGLVREWKGLLGELEAGGHFVPMPYSSARYIGVKGMRPLADSVLRQNDRVKVVRPCWISKLEPINGKWHLSENGKPQGQFDAIVVAHNGKCANRLLSSSGLPLLTKQMKSVELSAIWALLAAFKDPVPVPQTAFEGAFVKGIDSVSWMANNTSKLFPSQNDRPQCWTFFSTAAYGKRNKVPQENIPNITAEKVKSDMIAGVEIALGLSKGSLQPFYSRVQLWGAALPTNTPAIPCIFDPHGRAGICGDWLLGASVEAAVTSGISLANHFPVFRYWIVRSDGASLIPRSRRSVGTRMADYFQSGGEQPDEFSIGLRETFTALGGHDIGQFHGVESEIKVLEPQTTFS